MSCRVNSALTMLSTQQIQNLENFLSFGVSTDCIEFWLEVTETDLYNMRKVWFGKYLENAAKLSITTIASFPFFILILCLILKEYLVGTDIQQCFGSGSGFSVEPDSVRHLDRDPGSQKRKEILKFGCLEASVDWNFFMKAILHNNIRNFFS